MIRNKNTLLKLWIRIKLFYSKQLKFINPINEELLFMKNKFSVDIMTLDYIKDTIFKKIQFDWQYDCIKLFENGGGDCNSIHRAWQVYYHLLKYESFLVTYIAKPFKLSHTTCVVKTDKNKYCLRNYNYTIEVDSIEKAIKICSQKYKSSIKCYVIQDINWKIIN